MNKEMETKKKANMMIDGWAKKHLKNDQVDLWKQKKNGKPKGLNRK